MTSTTARCSSPARCSCDREPFRADGGSTFGRPPRAGGRGVEGQWVVTEPDGGIVHPDTLLGRWKRLVSAVGVPPIPLHGARHSYAMLALGAGARLDDVSRQLGHASAAFTADIYAHHSDE